MADWMNCNQYHQKLIGLSLLKVTDIDGAKSAFAEVIRTSIDEARRQLLHIQNNNVLLNGNYGIVCKKESSFWLYDSDGSATHEISEQYLDTYCHSHKRTALERAIRFLKERR